jgi:hypothetical protein
MGFDAAWLLAFGSQRSAFLFLVRIKFYSSKFQQLFLSNLTTGFTLNKEVIYFA